MSALSIKDLKKIRVLLSRPAPQYPIGLVPALRPPCKCGEPATVTIYTPVAKMLCAKCAERKE